MTPPTRTLFWLLGCFAAGGMLSPHDYPAYNRLMVLVPPLCFLAARAALRLPRWMVVPVVTLAVLANIGQWFWLVRTRTQISAMSYAHHAVQDDRCRLAPLRTVIVSDPGELPRQAHTAFELTGEDMPLFAESVPEDCHRCVVRIHDGRAEVRYPCS